MLFWDLTVAAWGCYTVVEQIVFCIWLTSFFPSVCKLGVIKLTVNCFRSPFGLCVSPAAAQRLNQHVFLVAIVTMWGQEGFTSWCLGFIELQARKVNFKKAYFGHNSNKNVYVWLQGWGQVSARYRVAVGRGETVQEDWYTNHFTDLHQNILAYFPTNDSK